MKFLVLLALLAMAALSLAKMQNITVKGVTVCNKIKQPNVKVELWEHDTLDPDDLLATVHSDSQGNFQVYGEEDEVTSIVPYLKLHHQCKVSKPECTRVTKFVIPKEKVGDLYDMTYVTLDIKQSEDKEKC